MTSYHECFILAKWTVRDSFFVATPGRVVVQCTADRTHHCIVGGSRYRDCAAGDRDHSSSWCLGHRAQNLNSVRGKADMGTAVERSVLCCNCALKGRNCCPEASEVGGRPSPWTLRQTIRLLYGSAASNSPHPYHCAARRLCRYRCAARMRSRYLCAAIATAPSLLLTRCENVLPSSISQPDLSRTVPSSL